MRIDSKATNTNSKAMITDRKVMSTNRKALCSNNKALSIGVITDRKVEHQQASSRHWQESHQGRRASLRKCEACNGSSGSNRYCNPSSPVLWILRFCITSSRFFVETGSSRSFVATGVSMLK